MHTVYFIDTSSHFYLDHVALRDLVLHRSTIDLMQCDPRGSKYIYQPRYNKDHFQQLVRSCLSLADLLDFFWSEDWINVMYQYVSVAKQDYIK